MSIEALKLKILNEIMALQNPEKLKKVEAILNAIESDDDIIKRLSKPMRKTTNIEEIAKEQNWKPIDKKEFFKLIDELDIQEPIEDLIAMI